MYAYLKAGMTRSSNIEKLLKTLIGLVILLLIGVGFLLYPYFYNYFKVAKWGVSDWFLFIQTLVFLSSAVIAYRTISSSKMVSRERATLDTILADNKDSHLSEAKSDLYSFINDYDKYYKKLKDDVSSRKTLTQICEVDDIELTTNELQLKHKMMIVLNRHEFYAIGINNKLFDENLFKRMHCSNFLKLWEKVSPAVTQFRSKVGKDTLFKEFECLAIRWKANPLRSEDIK